MSSYDPNDATQADFLAHLRQTESGGRYDVGVGPNGGVDLSNAPRGLFGFPLWSGTGDSHAAGAYQFQPGTWRELAAKYGFDFSSHSDQDAAAWIKADETYKAKTQGGDLKQAIANGDVTSIKNALGSTWTSIKNWSGTTTQPGGELAPGQSSGGGTPNPLLHPIDALKSYFVRGSMIFVGALILLVALWALLQHSGAASKLSLT